MIQVKMICSIWDDFLILIPLSIITIYQNETDL